MSPLAMKVMPSGLGNNFIIQGDQIDEVTLTIHDQQIAVHGREQVVVAGTGMHRHRTVAQFQGRHFTAVVRAFHGYGDTQGLGLSHQVLQRELEHLLHGMRSGQGIERIEHSSVPNIRTTLGKVLGRDQDTAGLLIIAQAFQVIVQYGQTEGVLHRE
jgi:hypothetical protein